MSLTETLNQINGMIVYSDKSYKRLKASNKTPNLDAYYEQFEKKEKIITNHYPKKKNSSNKKVFFGFWKNPYYVEKKEIEISNPKFPFLSDPYLDLIDEEKIIEIKHISKSIQDIEIKEEIEKSEIYPDIPIKNLEKSENFPEIEFNINGDLFSNNELISMLNYNINRLFDVRNTFDKYVSNHKDRELILKEVSYNVLKSKLSGKKLKHWIENFPNELDRKIKAIRNKTKPKNEKLSQAKKDEYYNPKVTELRFKTVNRMLEARHYYNVNSDLIYGRISVLCKSQNLDIVMDIIANLPKEVDNDMIEFDENKQFQEYIKECEVRYKDHE